MATTRADEDIELDKLSQEDVDRKPWRFDGLHCRILLRLQDQLAGLEEELDLLDAEFSRKTAKDVDNGSFRKNQESRKEVLESITAKLERYDLDALPGDAEMLVVGKDEHVDVLAVVAILFTASVMLIAPLWILAVIEDMFKKLGVITAFVFVFLGVLVWGILARPFETLAATAGYSVVLVVFLQFSTGLQNVRMGGT
ncbi:hypothetical protein B0H66DRAFT_599263 [Apodospora peruviana]|uniref:DUF6594 domain-containing protein n=1 Tax=Apodospora peruviana TaxID=516989 RepID=A0AAE0II03_9PEZI|nr:hypothetical protein B0H66DRAFT_599263 [Apodospora peruviana]